MNFCPHCAAPLALRIPPGDALPRHVCDACGRIHYQNPKLVVGCIPEWENRVLLCRRAIEPRYGLWTLPAGFMENNETTADAALRETLEEAGAHVELLDMFALVNVPHISQVHILYRARLLEPDFAPGCESLEVELLAEKDIPWNQLAFRSIEFALRRFFADRKTGTFGFHVTDLPPPAATA